jgi:hypothetical protein
MTAGYLVARLVVETAAQWGQKRVEPLVARLADQWVASLVVSKVDCWVGSLAE